MTNPTYHDELTYLDCTCLPGAKVPAFNCRFHMSVASRALYDAHRAVDRIHNWKSPFWQAVQQPVKVQKYDHFSTKRKGN